MGVTVRRRQLPDIFQAACSSGVVVGDFVYVSGDVVGAEVYQVSKVDPTDESKMPFVGVVVEKLTDTLCVVQVTGVVSKVYSSLTPGKLVLAGLDARPSESLARPSSGIRVRQVVGLAISSTDMLIQPMVPVVVNPL